MADQDDGPDRPRQDPWAGPAGMFQLGLRPIGIVPEPGWDRPKGDPVLCRQAFDAAFRRDQTPAAPRSALDANALLLEAFGDGDVLPLPDFVAAHDEARKRRLSRIERYPRPDPDPLAYEAAGDFAGHCSRLRFIAVDGTEEGAPRFRLLDRQMQFARQGGRVVRVRGLTPAELDQRDRKLRTEARRSDTLDRKARDAATPVIGGLINELVRLDRHVAVPAAWHTQGYLPAALAGRSVAESAAFIVEYHHGAAFDRTRLAGWQACLARAVEHAAGRPPPGNVPKAREPGSVAPDDLDALMALARARDA